MSNFESYKYDGNEDYSAKQIRRTARASCTIIMNPSTIKMIKENRLAKGDIIGAARIAGIMSGKKTSDLIPLCHNTEIDRVAIEFDILEDRINIESLAVCTDKSGIEMEALTSASIAALTIWDMCKVTDNGMIITDLTLFEKTIEMPFKIESVNVYTKNENVAKAMDSIELVADFGVSGDCHAGKDDRHVSFLASEDMGGATFGTYCENINTSGVDISSLPLGTHFYIDDTELEITHTGHDCSDCDEGKLGDKCKVLNKGVFARVIKGGLISHESSCYYRIRQGK